MRLLLILLSISLFACKSGSNKKETAQTDSIPATNTSTPPETKPSAFDINSIPISNKPLGSFPYLSLPEGYDNFANNKITDYDLFYVWVGDHFEHPEGKIFWDRISANEGKQWSELELTQHLTNAITAIGGVKVFQGKVPADSVNNSIDQERKLKYLTGFAFMGYAPTTTYLIRRADRNIWVQYSPTDDGASYGWAIVETKPIAK